MTLVACALAWFFAFADLVPARPNGALPIERSQPFADRAECEVLARAMERISPSYLVYEIAPGRRCFQAPPSSGERS